MSDEAAPLKPAEPPGAKPSKAMLGILVVNLLATLFVTFKVVTAHPAEAAGPHEAAEAPLTSEITGPVVALDPFVVNLDEPGTPRYLKVTLEIELTGGGKGGEGGEGALAKSKQLIRDAVLSHLSGLHVKDTLGAEAKDKIRTDLTAKLTKLLGPEKIRRMFFQDFVVQ
jgi:flagellar FliL protein